MGFSALGEMQSIPPVPHILSLAGNQHTAPNRCISKTTRQGILTQESNHCVAIAFALSNTVEQRLSE